MAAITCPSCGGPVAIEDVDLASKLAKCRPCAEVFDFRKQVRGAQDEARRRRELVPPSGYRVIEDRSPRLPAETATYRDAAGGGPGTSVRVVRAWWTVRSITAAIFASGWLALATVSIFRSLGRASGEGLGTLVLFFLCPGLVMMALAIAHVVNRTTIALGDGQVRVTHGPFPWRGGRSTPSDSIRSLAVVSRRASFGSSAPIVYDVIGDTREDPSRVIVSGLPGEPGARFVARTISERLGLPDPA